MIFPLISVGQKYYEAFAEVDIGMSITYGDVKRYDFAPTTIRFSEIQPGGQIKVGYFFDELLGVQLGYNYTLLSGASPQKNLYFLGKNSEISAQLKLSFNQILEENLTSQMANRLKLFLSFGYGRLNYNTELEKYNKNKQIEIEPENYTLGTTSGSTGTIPVELTIMYKLNDYNPAFWQRIKDRYYLTLSGGVHFSGSDMVDGYQGRGFGKDFFGFYSLGIAYFFAR